MIHPLKDSTSIGSRADASRKISFSRILVLKWHEMHISTNFAFCSKSLAVGELAVENATLLLDHAGFVSSARSKMGTQITFLGADVYFLGPIAEHCLRPQFWYAGAPLSVVSQ